MRRARMLFPVPQETIILDSIALTPYTIVARHGLRAV